MPSYICPLFVERDDDDGTYRLADRGQNCGLCIHWEENQCVHEDTLKTITDVRRVANGEAQIEI